MYVLVYFDIYSDTTKPNLHVNNFGRICAVEFSYKFE